MRALRWHGRNDVRLDEVEVPPPPRRGQLQLKVLACGICGTDLEEVRDGPIFIPVEPHALTGCHAPIVLGHEVVGEVILSPEGSRFKVGDVVAVDGITGCGTCRLCRRGMPNLCANLASIGLMQDGGLAEIVNVPEIGCFLLPARLSPAEGVLIETLAVGVRALRRARFMPGESVLILGAGAVGLLAAQAALLYGASKVAVSDPNLRRQQLARDLGACETYSPDEMPENRFDIAIECSGSAAAIPGAVAATEKTGRTILVGISKQAAAVDVLTMVTGEREILGSLSHVYSEDFSAAVRLAEREEMQFTPLIGRRVTLERAIADGFDVLSARDDVVKIVVEPGRSDNYESKAGLAVVQR